MDVIWHNLQYTSIFLHEIVDLLLSKCCCPERCITCGFFIDKNDPRWCQWSQNGNDPPIQNYISTVKGPDYMIYCNGTVILL